MRAVVVTTFVSLGYAGTRRTGRGRKMIDRNDPNESIVAAFTRDSRPPVLIHGLCQYCSDASGRRWNAMPDTMNRS
jgi:hypothetical protein